MRITVDLPEDIHRLAKDMARDRGQSFSAALVELVRRGLRLERCAVVPDSRAGFPTLRVGQPVTSEDVARLEDDE